MQLPAGHMSDTAIWFLCLLYFCQYAFDEYDKQWQVPGESRVVTEKYFGWWMVSGCLSVHVMSDSFPFVPENIISFRYARDASVMRLVIVGTWPRYPGQFIGIWWIPCKNNERFFLRACDRTSVSLQLTLNLRKTKGQRERGRRRRAILLFVILSFVICQ